MKLLFDQNVSFRAVKALQTLYPDACHVKDLGLENNTDKEIWNYAKNNHVAIITFDADFYDLMTLYGHPLKILWLILGNTSTQNLIKILEAHVDIIKSFLTDLNYSNIGCLELDERHAK